MFWIGISLFALVSSCELGLGDFQDPGPGLMPFLVGAALLVVSAIFLLKLFSKPDSSYQEKANKRPERINRRKVTGVSASLLAWAFVVEGLGYLLASFFLFTFLFRITGIAKWKYVITAAVLTTVGSFLFFKLLGVRFPLGILRGI